MTLWTIRRHPEIRDAMLEDDFLKAICAREVRDGMNCVDVGAHLGAMTAVFGGLSPSGRHACVEPTPHKAAWLRRRYPDVQVVEAALAEEPGEATFFHQERNSGYSGLAKHEAGVNDSQHVEQLTVRVQTLDGVIPADRRVHLLKIDVEGAELRVFRGASRILTNDRPLIIFECTCTGLPSNGFTSAMLYDHLAGLGYDIWSPRDFLEGNAPLTRDELENATHFPYRAFSFIATHRERPATRPIPP